MIQDLYKIESEIYDMELLIKIHPECPNKHAISPPRLKGDVGWDLSIWIENGGKIEIAPFSMANLRTGVFVKLPDNAWGDIRPRSSTFSKRNLFVQHATIDCGYTGELSIFTWNPTDKPHAINNGDRIAQLVIIPMPKVLAKYVAELPQTERSSSGFGSTGL